MARSARRIVLALLLAGLSLATPGAAAELDVLVRDFGVAPAGLKPAPAFSLRTLDGSPATLAARRGRAVLLYFWATW